MSRKVSKNSGNIQEMTLKTDGFSVTGGWWNVDNDSADVTSEGRSMRSFHLLNF